MNATHTPENWMIPPVVKDGKVQIVAESDCYLIAEVNAENKLDAKRIIDCVNAMKGILYPSIWMPQAKAMLDKIYNFNPPGLKIGESRLEAILLAAQATANKTIIPLGKDISREVTPGNIIMKRIPDDLEKEVAELADIRGMIRNTENMLTIISACESHYGGQVIGWNIEDTAQVGNEWFIAIRKNA